jgi:hypothetical protein
VFSTCCIAFCMSLHMIKLWSLCLVIARSISEEFSSGDTRYRESEDYPHTREKGKEKEDRDEGKISILQVVNMVNCTFTASHCCWCWMKCTSAGIETFHVFCNRYFYYKAWYKLEELDIIWFFTSVYEYQECFLGVKAAGAQGWQPCHLHVLIVMKSGSLNLLELSGPVKACNGIALPLPF